MKPMLILKTGSTLPQIVDRRGDFELWIRRGLGWSEDRIRVVSVHEGERLPEPGEFVGVVVTGSAAMVSAREPWSEKSGRWLVEALDHGVPILGICYGHQLLAQALGGRVGPNPNGRAIGTVEVVLESAAVDDPLLRGLPPRVPFQASHVESILELPPRARLLATSALDPHHVFAMGELAWGIQFHPEFDAEIMRGYIEGRRAQVEAEGLDADALLAAVTETPEAGPLIRRFGEIALRASRTS